jgi:hypothetical protein
MRLIKQGSKKPLKMRKKYVFSQSAAKFAVKKNKIKLLLRGRVDHKLKGKIPRIEIYDLSKDPNEQHPIKIDDLSNHADLYDAVYKKLVMKKRGIHIVFSDQLKGKILEGEIHFPPGKPEIKTFFEIGVTKEDFTQYEKRKEKIIFNWKMSHWNKSLILTSRRDKLKIKFKLKVDGKDYRDFIIDESLVRDSEYIKLSKRAYKSPPKDKAAEVLLFGNGLIKRATSKRYFPGVNKKNLEKLKALGYIN